MAHWGRAASNLLPTRISAPIFWIKKNYAAAAGTGGGGLRRALHHGRNLLVTYPDPAVYGPCGPGRNGQTELVNSDNVSFDTNLDGWGDPDVIPGMTLLTAHDGVAGYCGAGCAELSFADLEVGGPGPQMLYRQESVNSSSIPADSILVARAAVFIPDLTGSGCNAQYWVTVGAGVTNSDGSAPEHTPPPIGRIYIDGRDANNRGKWLFREQEIALTVLGEFAVISMGVYVDCVADDYSSCGPNVCDAGNILVDELGVIYYTP